MVQCNFLMLLVNSNSIYKNKYESIQNKNCPEKEGQSVNFGGFTRLVLNTEKNPLPFFSTGMFLKIAEPFKSKIVGRLPKDFLSLFPKKPVKVFQFFNEFSNFARTMDFPNHENLHRMVLTLPSSKTLKAEYLGKGDFGMAFKLDLGNEKNYVIKVFNQNYKDEFAVHGSTAEARTGLNLCGKDYSDLLKFHIADFSDDNMWQISEFIDKEKDSVEKRLGKKWLEDRKDLYFEDSTNKDNIINGVKIDLGGVNAIKFAENSSYHENPHINNAASKIELLSIEDRKQAFYDILNKADTKDKEGLAKQIWHLKAKDRKQAFYDVLNHYDEKVKTGLARHLDCLNNEDELKQVFYDILYHPSIEAKKGIATKISWLKQKDLLDAFYSSLYHPEPEVKKGLINQIVWLNDCDKEEAYRNFVNSMSNSMKTFNVSYE